MRNETLPATQHAFQPTRFSWLAHCTQQQTTSAVTVYFCTNLISEKDNLKHQALPIPWMDIPTWNWLYGTTKQMCILFIFNKMHNCHQKIYLWLWRASELLLLHPFNGLFSRTTWVSWHQKGKSFWILLVQEMMGWHMVVEPYANHLHLVPGR